ncbi:iron-containing alcohol dehydrogenase family protein [Bacillus timonensis]|uniref:Iron-containing alcohol dehydrogenase family protein n=1 Tax=Bacillus timonensis TaxID=1033734 RepID=A0A4S3PJY1_9BACI|nr:iron-containing alcohol dehydrogenase family protein [Bacillus timonensis]THE09740.1 iron-containing alcohol dehydrogenase family protein [Bacillus timonensis]
MDIFSVHGAPSEYSVSEGVLCILEEKLAERSYQNVLFVHGIKSWEAAKEYIPEFYKIQSEQYTYSGECSITEIESLSSFIKRKSFDAVIGIGGGKVLDLVKATSHLSQKPYVLIPTLASNCAPWTPLSVIYDDHGSYIRYDMFPNNASLVLVEPKILLHAPIEMLIAGIGDTLAKWYEADVQMARIENKSVPLLISHYSARQCKDLLMKHAEAAIEAAKSGVLTDDFIKVVETIIVLGGMVGGFGDHYGRVAGAHSIHNGLTVLEETHSALHGEKVAYGVLVQLVLENKLDEINELLPLYKKLGLPVSIRDLGVSNVLDESINQVAEKSTIPGESIHAMPIGTITAADVSKAINNLEKYILHER